MYKICRLYIASYGLLMDSEVLLKRLEIFLIAYSGKITLLKSIFVFYTQQIRHPGILINSLEPMGYFFGTGQRHLIPLLFV